MKNEARRELAAALDGTDLREVRAHRAAEIVRAKGGYRWVGIYDVEDDRFVLVGHTGPSAPVHPHFPITQGLSGEAIRARSTIVCNDVSRDARYLTAFESTGSEMIVPILGAESGIPIGTLDVESDKIDAFGDEDRAFVESCALALMPLFE